MISLELVKHHLRLELDENNQDVYLSHLISSAVSAFEGTQNRTLLAADQTLPDPVGNAILLDASIIQGALLLIGHWYNNRESVVLGISSAELPFGTQYSWGKHKFNHL